MNYDETERSYSKQKDLVLNINEFAHILSKTDGNIKVATGPYQTSLSQQEVPVIFNKENKRFEECVDYDRAKQLFISAPEGWYVVLKNPTPDGRHPEAGKPNQSPTNMMIGTKINIKGPTSFALFPGQMAKVIQGHRLRSNQYLLARVYDAEAANKKTNTAVVASTANGEVAVSEIVSGEQEYTVGQLLIIKGTEVSFYIPPTGIEIVPDNHGRLVREAVTVERLEYCVLKDEDGNRRYMHGPCVVFPEPTELFVKSDDENHPYCFKAIELSPTSGIYIKVIAPYIDDNGKEYSIGEELFITGNEQMIYYPRPEHSIISYDNKMVHYAIAIPEGEGRYIMNKLTGEIKTVKGPDMYLPDPRAEVMVKRKLTKSQCELWYPNNNEVLNYNVGMDMTVADSLSDLAVSNCLFSATPQSDVKMVFNRSNTYTPPRSISFNNKFDGAVTINVWTGYAINCVSKSGKRDVVVGPATKLLDYSENLETLELSTGKPKTTDNLFKTVYLRIDNNKISDIINVVTSDFVNINIKVSYTVDFLKEYKDKWFLVENYVKYLCDRMRSLVKEEVIKYDIQNFYGQSSDIIKNIILGEERKGTLFEENGMFIKDVDVLSIHIEDNDISQIINAHQFANVKDAFDLTKAQKRVEITTVINQCKKAEIECSHALRAFEIQKDNEIALNAYKAKIENLNREEDIQKRKQNMELQEAESNALIRDIEINESKEQEEFKFEMKQRTTELELAKQAATAKAVQEIMSSVSPDLIAAIETSSNRDMLSTVSKSIAPYAMARDTNVADFVNTLLKGTSLENVIDKLAATKSE